MKLNGYDLHRWDRSYKQGGGVSIYVRSDLISLEVIDQNLRGELVEKVWCRITLGSGRILVVCIYITEENKARGATFIYKKTNEFVSSGTFDSLLVTDDFNMGNISWWKFGMYLALKSLKEGFSRLCMTVSLVNVL